ncbi:DUF6484 domain-containing protein [Myxococcus xanthus]|uniref:DUF6484 domain-containing protein n=1 Tax=Myxococcus xanthus TaxID=34 RepID=A0A7Y4IHL7_MYXXA|nr:DUF6484 domain-containing protein [Myxococcus xanthus]NOJ79309.1 hypothetical protein [Myxococcus xanthus]NOJ86104.1 hypothetical protein [Myxococcus xanthus]
MASHEQDAGRPPSQVEEPILGNLIGRVVGRGRMGTVQVDFEGNHHGPLEARLAVAVDEATLLRAIEARQEAVLCFERGTPTCPIVLGLLQPRSETPLLDAMLEAPDGEREDGEVAIVANGQRVPIEGLLDGATEELELRCGRSSLVLRRNGQILLRGEHVLVDAGQVLRLRGGKTQIN